MNVPNPVGMIPVGPMVALPVPPEFSGLHQLAYNLWWSWDTEATALWSSIDAKQWAANANPITLLQQMKEAEWEVLAASDAFVDRYHDVEERLDAHLRGEGSWYQTEHDGALDGPVAYVCAEYGIQEKMRLYSGGLGVLAGDHLKAASDLGLPLVAVGLLYRRGYFQQAVDPEGNQQHTYLPIEPSRRPIRRVIDPGTGLPLAAHIDLPDRVVSVAAWRLDVGRVPLILLDTDVPENHPADRPITHALYVRGREMRFLQELILGVGAVRILAALNLDPVVWHVNEGHAALSLIERLARAGGTGEAPQRLVRDRTVFTLHTPVPAGNEVFPVELVRRYLEVAVPDVVVDDAATLAQAREETAGSFDLGALAIRLAARVNGVSRRHAAVVSDDWGHLIEGDALAITNGVHPQTWVGSAVSRIFRRVFGDDWQRRAGAPGEWSAIRDVPDADLWNAHFSQKRRMLRIVRNRLRDQYARHGRGPDELRAVDEQLPDDRLTICFARRFATYKRANLLFSDPARLRRLLTDPARPVQVLFAGKAHPADREGQALIRWVVEMSRSPDLAGHIFFVENYDVTLAAALVQGADIWLNNPRPPKEASGTSGMKAGGNGGLNLSVLDGWWVEGYTGKNGWGFAENSVSDAEDAATLYHMLESEVVPLFYERNEAGIPVEWVAAMKEAIASILPGFSAQRMVREYTERAYLPLATAGLP